MKAASTGTDAGTSRRWALVAFSLLGVSAVLLALAWRFTGLSEWIEPEQIRQRLLSLRGSPWATPVVCAIFVVAGLVLVPVNVLFLAVGITFEFVHALWLSMAGGLVSALVTHRIGRRLDLDGVLERAPARMRRISRGLDRARIPHLVVLRVLPLGPFTTMNLLWGAAGVPIGRLLAASLIGLAPGVVTTAMIGSGVAGLGRRDLSSLAMLAGGLVGFLALAWIARRKLSGRASGGG